MQRDFRYGVAALAAMGLIGCNGAADGTDPTGDNGSYSLTIKFQTRVDGVCGEITDTQSFNAGDSFCAVASLSKGSSPQSGEIIDFSTTLGSLSAATALTSADGKATLVVNNPDAAQGAGTASVSFTPDEGDSLRANRNFEFVGEPTPPTATLPSLNASILQSGEAVTRFRVDEAVQLQAKLTDNEGNGLANQLVTFSAGNASLTPNTALTSETGVAQVSYTPAEAELGAHSLTVSAEINGNPLTGTSLYEVIAKDAIGTDGILKLGYFDGSDFVEGKLKTTLTANADGKYVVSAGGSFGITATLVSEASDGSITLVQTPSSISFSSDCVTAEAATLDSPVTTLSGSADSTFQDVSCSGNSERDDQIVATTLAGNETLTATLPFSLARQTLANLSFVSAEPSSIRIKGSGGTDASESSLVTFKVSSANGQGAAQQEVDFSLDTVVGGITFASGEITDSSLTNAEGLVSVRVLAGTVPTPVRIQASATDGDSGETIVTQSEQLSINTGLPQQLSMSLATSNANPETDNTDGVEVTITARLADSFGNPVPNDTTINFTTEGGQIQPSCVTSGGGCSVTWTSANPRVPDHRITVMAYALGHETFFDTNGNNIFDAADGSAVVACLDGSGNAASCSGNGMDREAYMASGFSDLPDAFRDDNENFSYDAGEKFFNTQGSNSYGAADGKFNGPQCEGSLCGEDQANKTYVRKALVMTMSGSAAFFTISQDGTEIYNSASGTVSASPISPNGSSSFTVRLYDSANQIMPSGTSVEVSADAGTVSFNGYTVPKGNSDGGTQTGFSLKHDGEAGVANVSIQVSTPAGIRTTLTLPVTLL